MIIEYLNEASVILNDKIESGEITYENACDAYNNIMESAIDEIAESILEAVSDNVITEQEALVYAEMVGIISNEDLVEESPKFDLSGLTPEQKKQIQNKLNSMSPKARKKAEETLAQQYPNKAAEKAAAEKAEKKKKLIRNIGIGAGVAAAAIGTGAAVNHHLNKKADQASINTNNSRYEGIIRSHESRLKQMETDRERELAEAKNKGLLPAEIRQIAAKWDKKISDQKEAYNTDISNARQKAIEDAGSMREYNKRNRRTAKAIKKINKEHGENVKQIESDLNENIEYAKQNRGRSFVNSIRNAFGKSKLGQKLGASTDNWNYGVTNGQIEKNFINKANDQLIDNDKDREDRIRNAYQ